MSCVPNQVKPGVFNMSNAIFNAAFDRINATVAFNPDWKNGTGYLNGAVVEQISETSKSVDDHGRKIILIPVVIGNLVLFERYKGGNGVIVCNCPRTIEAIVPGLSNQISDETLSDILGSEYEPDIGQRLRKFAELSAKKAVAK